MYLIRKLTKKVDSQKLIDALLITSIVVLTVIYKLNKA